MLMFYLASLASIMESTSTLSCPGDLVEWSNRAADLNCDNQKSEFYHCMLDSTTQLVEICMQHALIKPGTVGCPWVHFRRTTPILGYPLLFCNSSQCPDSTHKGYYTDMLYLYPTCFEQESNRTSNRQELKNVKAAIRNSRPEDTAFSKARTNINAPLISIIVIAAVLALTNIVSILVIIWQRRKMKAKDSARDDGITTTEEEKRTLNS